MLQMRAHTIVSVFVLTFVISEMTREIDAGLWTLKRPRPRPSPPTTPKQIKITGKDGKPRFLKPGEIFNIFQKLPNAAKVTSTSIVKQPSKTMVKTRQRTDDFANSARTTLQEVSKPLPQSSSAVTSLLKEITETDTHDTAARTRGFQRGNY